MSKRKSRAAAKSGIEGKAPPPSADVRAASERPPQAGIAQPGRAQASVDWMLALVLIGIGIAAWHNTFQGAFLLDDKARIVDNLQIRQFWPPWAAMGQTPRPITQFTLALNYAAGGLDPWGYHAVNLAIHLLAGLVLFGVVHRMLDCESLRARYGGASRWLAMAVAAVWLAHPLQTESVTYVIQRGESLMGLFYLITLYCGIRAFDSPHPRAWGIAAVVACALGMGCKQVMVSAPILVWLYDRMFVSPTIGATFRRHGGLYAGLAATWIVLGITLAMAPPEEDQYLVAGLDPWHYALTQSEVIVHYLRLAVWPDSLVFDYAWPVTDSLASVLPSAIFVLALLGGTVLALWKRIWVGFWGAWFFLVLAPTSSVLPIADIAFEHRMYLPLAAVAAVVIIGGHELFARLAQRLRVPGTLQGWVETVLVVVAVVALGYETTRRNADYRSELAMWSDTVAKRPGNPRAHNNLGIALRYQGRHGEAIAQYREALRLKPTLLEARNNLGSTLVDQGRSEEAIVELTESLRIDPDQGDTRNSLGSALVAVGRHDEAIGHLTAALRLKRNFAEAQNNLGAALYRQGKRDEAIVHYREAIRIKPRYVEAQFNLGSALMDQGNNDAAVIHLAEALRLNPNYAEAHNNLGVVLYKQGKVEDAIAHFASAARLRPDMAAAGDNLRRAEASPRPGKSAR